MRIADVEILIIPGWSSSGPEHWQTRWERSLKTARRVEQKDWYNPSRESWVARIRAECAAAQKPVVLVAHSLGVIAAVAALTDAPAIVPLVVGAFLVAPADVDNARDWPVTEGQMFNPEDSGFLPVPTAKLPCAAMLIGSATDPYCRAERARTLAAAWGAKLVEAGDNGHINAKSGHGPWPDGLLQLGSFLRSLGPAPGAIRD